MLDRARDARAVAVAMVGHGDVAGLQRKRGEPVAAIAVRDAHLAEPAGGEIIGQMQPPVIPRTAGLPQGDHQAYCMLELV